MAHLDHSHEPVWIVNSIGYPIMSLPDAVFILSRQFLASFGARVVGETADPLHHPLAIIFQRDTFNFFYR